MNNKQGVKSLKTSGIYWSLLTGICDVQFCKCLLFGHKLDKLFIGCHKPFSVHFHQLYVLWPGLLTFRLNILQPADKMMLEMNRLVPSSNEPSQPSLPHISWLVNIVGNCPVKFSIIQNWSTKYRKLFIRIWSLFMDNLQNFHSVLFLTLDKMKIFSNSVG